MKKVIKYFLIGLSVMTIFTFLLGLFDDAFQKTGVWYKDIIGSFKYYFFWVIPYWWFFILIGGVIIGLLSYGIRIGISKLKA
jgi:hypothetical protein